MRMRAIFFLGALGWLLTVYGCGGDSTPSSPAGNGTGGTTGTVQPGTGPVALANLAHEFTIAECNFLYRCLRVSATAGVSAATCVAVQENAMADGLVAQIGRAITSGRVVYDPAAMRTCLDAYPQLSCDYSNEPALSAACTAALRGTVALGGECDADLECADNMTSTYCASDGTCPGHCQGQIALGQSCLGTGPCQTGLSCDSVTITCVSELRLGAPCDPNQDLCGGLTTCQTDTATGRSSCAELGSGPVVGEGGDCDGPLGPCADGLLCMAAGTGDGGLTSYRCQPRPVSGGACRYAINNPCPEGQYCPVSASEAATATGTCTPQAGANQPCDRALLYQCPTGTVCNDANVCATKQRLGGPCGIDGECYSYQCTGGVCVVPLGCAG